MTVDENPVPIVTQTLIRQALLIDEMTVVYFKCSNSAGVQNGGLSVFV